MQLDEQITGVITFPVLEGDAAYHTVSVAFDDRDVIRSTCSITAQCCNDDTLSIGSVRPSELSLQLRIRHPEASRYRMFGAKISLYTRYGSGEPLFRGDFFVTSAKRRHNVYTLHASDALVWMQSGSYQGAESDHTLAEKLGSSFLVFDDAVQRIVSHVNDALSAAEVDPILYRQSYDTVFQNPEHNGSARGYVLIPQEVAGYPLSIAPADFLLHLTQLAAGCAQMVAVPSGAQSVHTLLVTPYGWTPNAVNPGAVYGSAAAFDSYFAAIEIPYDTIQQDCCDIADYAVIAQLVYAQTYEKTKWSNAAPYQKYGGNAVFDLSGNPFLDGRLYHDRDHASAFGILNRVAETLHSITIKPYTITCHIQPQQLQDLPKLGQRIRIEQQPGDWIESIITRWKWSFRGGWEFSCAGSDLRVLSQAAKKSLASHAAETARAYTNLIANDLRKIIQP